MSAPSHASPPQLVHRLLHQSKLFLGMPTGSRDALSAQFEAIPFTEGDVLVKAGDVDRSLGVVIEGHLAVVARRGDQVFRINTLKAGALFGEVAFFDPSATRSADLLGASDGILALLPYERFLVAVEDEDVIAEMFEKNVLAILANRVNETGDTLAHLLEERRKGGMWAALWRFFRGER